MDVDVFDRHVITETNKTTERIFPVVGAAPCCARCAGRCHAPSTRLCCRMHTGKPCCPAPGLQPAPRNTGSAIRALLPPPTPRQWLPSRAVRAARPQVPDHDYPDFFPCLDRIRVINEGLCAIDELDVSRPRSVVSSPSLSPA